MNRVGGPCIILARFHKKENLHGIATLGQIGKREASDAALDKRFSFL
jgi:hypothetical protein